MRVILAGLAVIAALVLVQIGALAVIAPITFGAQRVMEAVVQCCGEELGAVAALIAFLGPIALLWFLAAN